MAFAPAAPPKPDALQADLDRDVDLTASKVKGDIDVEREKQRALEMRSGLKGSYAKEDLDIAKKRADRDAAQLADEEQSSLAAKNFKIDPNRYMHNASFLQKAIMLIGGAAGGLSAGLKGGPNSYLEFLNKMVDRDIDQQKGQYEQLKQRGVDIHNAWSMNVRKDGSEDQLRNAVKAQALDAAADHYQAQVDATNNPTLIADGKLRVNAVREKADLYRKQAADANKPKGDGGAAAYDKRLDAAERDVSKEIAAGTLAKPDGSPFTEAERHEIAQRRVPIGGKYATGAGPGSYQAKPVKGNASAEKVAAADARADADLAEMAALRKNATLGVLSPQEYARFRSLQAEYGMNNAVAGGIRPTAFAGEVAEQETGGDGRSDVFGGSASAIESARENRRHAALPGATDEGEDEP